MEPDGFYRMTPLEVATGWVAGFDPPPSELPTPGRDPLAALEAAIRPAFEAGRCLVSFSGGRDSSAVLAVAVEVAKREGFTLPIPITQVYPTAPETDESEWQEAVVRHLGLTDWERLTYAAGEVDFIGPAATKSLRRIGVVWPPSVHTKERLWTTARGGTLLTGEGGDEIFGIRRVTPLTGLLRRRVTPRRRALRMAAAGLSPRPLRRRLTAPALCDQTDLPWLTAAALADYRDVVLADTLDEPLPWNRSVVNLLGRRGPKLGGRNLALAAAAYETTLIDPLLDPGFVHAYAESGGILGFPGRSAATRMLFAGLLPEEVITREDKVHFNRVRFSEVTKRFAAVWDGEGVDADLVIPERLRRVWESDKPHAGSAALLQQAWLHEARN